jgi:phosphoglycerate dehydrogenase-like enzyme
MDQLPPRVLVADQPEDLAIERAALPGIEVRAFPEKPDQGYTVSGLLEAVRERPAPVLVVWSGARLDRAALETLAGLGVHGMVCSSVGYDHVDLRAAADLGITVCNVPDYGTDEVADHTMALLLWSLRKLGEAAPTAATPGAFWNDRVVPLPRLSECTLALLGFGRIGQAVGRRAEAFGMKVRWYDPYVPRGQDKVTRTSRAESLPELLHDADALSIHCFLSAETRGMVNADALALLPSRAVVINTARGPIVDEPALLAALRAGTIAGAALDVLEREPPGDTPLFSAYVRGELPRVLISPHVAWYSEGSAKERKRKAAAEAGRLLRGEPPFNPLRA